jgi:hypothetical protein
MKCIFTKNLTKPTVLPEKWKDLTFIAFPEKNMSMLEQQKFDQNNYNKDFIITNSPFIVSCFRSADILICEHGASYSPPSFEVYGASVNAILKQLHKVESCLPTKITDEMDSYMNGDVNDALSYMESIGSSTIKDYMLIRLRAEIKIQQEKNGKKFVEVILNSKENENTVFKIKYLSKEHATDIMNSLFKLGSWGWGLFSTQEVKNVLEFGLKITPWDNIHYYEDEKDYKNCDDTEEEDEVFFENGKFYKYSY